MTVLGNGDPAPGWAPPNDVVSCTQRESGALVVFQRQRNGFIGIWKIDVDWIVFPCAAVHLTGDERERGR